MAGIWVSGGAYPIACADLAGAGSWTAGLGFGGENSTPTYITGTYEYDGNAWAASGGLSTGRQYHAGAGTQTGAFAVGGYNTAILSSAEKYNGSSWSSASFIAIRYDLAAAGTSTAGLCAGGYDGGSVVAGGYEFNGTTWTGGFSMSSNRRRHAGVGTQTAGLMIAGSDNSGTALSTTEEYDGTAFASGGSITTARYGLSAGGLQTSASMFGGRDMSRYFTTTQEYNGTTWANGGGMLTGREFHAGAGGGQNACIGFGGLGSSGRLSSTEEYGDGTPVAFSFTDQTEVEIGTLIYSDTITPTGYDVPTSFSASGGYVSISGGAWVTSGTITPGQTVQLRITSSGSYYTQTSMSLTIGGVSDTWYVTTRTKPTPAQIIFI